MSYPKGHPLHGRSPEDISVLAGAAAEHLASMSSEGNTYMFPSSFASLAHEYERLKADVVSLGLDDDIYRRTIDNRDTRIAELKSTHPPEDWLTIAVEASGAPEGLGWNGLLKHVRTNEIDRVAELKSPTPLTQIAADVANPTAMERLALAAESTLQIYASSMVGVWYYECGHVDHASSPRACPVCEGRANPHVF